MRDELADSVEPARVSARELGDRPVAPEQQARRTEGRERVVHVGAEMFRRPSRRVGLGIEAGELAIQIRQRRERAHVLSPLIEETGADGGFAEMNENEA